MRTATPYTHDNGCVAFIGIDKTDRREYFRNYNATRKQRREERKKAGTLKRVAGKKYVRKAYDKRKEHRATALDSEHLCPVHNTPLKRYTANRNRFKGYDSKGEKIFTPNVYYRCNHCKWSGLKSDYPEKYFTERLETK